MFPKRAGMFPISWPVCSHGCGLRLLFAPNVNSYKRYAAGASPPRRWPGARQPHLRCFASWATGRPCASKTACPAATRTPTWRSRPCSPPAWPASTAGPRARAGRSTATPTRPTSRTCRPTLRDARELFAASDVAREAFGEDVVAHYLNNADVELARVRRRGHRLGALPGVRAPVTPVIGLSTALERARWSAWDQPAHVLCARVRRTRCRRAGGLAVLLPPDPRASDDARTRGSTCSTA